VGKVFTVNIDTILEEAS